MSNHKTTILITGEKSGKTTFINNVVTDNCGDVFPTNNLSFTRDVKFYDSNGTEYVLDIVEVPIKTLRYQLEHHKNGILRKVDAVICMFDVSIGHSLCACLEYYDLIKSVSNTILFVANLIEKHIRLSPNIIYSMLPKGVKYVEISNFHNINITLPFRIILGNIYKMDLTIYTQTWYKLFSTSNNYPDNADNLDNASNDLNNVLDNDLDKEMNDEICTYINAVPVGVLPPIHNTNIQIN